MTVAAISLLFLPLTTPLLILSGMLSGAGGALVLTPVTIELSRRSTDADRGSAFALFSGSLATAIAIGAIGVRRWWRWRASPRRWSWGSR